MKKREFGKENEMFVSKKKYERLKLAYGAEIDKNINLKGLEKISADKIKLLNEKNNDLQKVNKTLEKRIEQLNETNNKILEENKKLINWIEKIINDVGCYKVDQNSHMRIPIQCNEPYGVDGLIGKRVSIPQIDYFVTNAKRGEW